MSCSHQKTGVTSPDGGVLPTVAQDCAISKPQTLCKTCVTDSDCLTSDSSDGTTLASSWLDACCHPSGVTLLGRVGSKLARLAGSGFIQIENGIASVVPSVPLRLTTLWHRWWKPTPASPPILGAPLPHPYQVIADDEGNFHGIKGVDSEDSISLWDSTTKTFAHTPLSEIPHYTKGLLPRATGIELTGFTPTAASGDVNAVRQEKVLSGTGLVFLTEQATVAGGCNSAKASVANTLALPIVTDSTVFTLKYSTALGLHFAADA